jgi:hypothetical protein
MEGLKPLEMEFAAIDAITETREIPGLVAHLTEIGVARPYDLSALPNTRKFHAVRGQSPFERIGAGGPRLHAAAILKLGNCDGADAMNAGGKNVIP